MQPQNTLVILSDEHNPCVLGAVGHLLIRTPNLDRLARRDTRFTAAYVPLFTAARGRSHLFLRISGRAP